MKIINEFIGMIDNKEVNNQSIYRIVEWLNEIHLEMTGDDKPLPEHILSELYDLNDCWFYMYKNSNLQDLENTTYMSSDNCKYLQLSLEVGNEYMMTITRL
ncbi:hypothetical protein ERAQ111492_00500 [Erysipelothrix aquatica]